MKLKELTKQEKFILLLALGTPLAFRGTWEVLATNFGVNILHLTTGNIPSNNVAFSWEIVWQYQKSLLQSGSFLAVQSIREIPGLLAIVVIFLLRYVKEPLLGIIFYIMLGLGVALTGFANSFTSFVAITVFMSCGFHYLDIVKESLAMQWVEMERYPKIKGKMIAIDSVGAICAMSIILLLSLIASLFGVERYSREDFIIPYMFMGCLVIALGIYALKFQSYWQETRSQNLRIILRLRYWRYYALVMLSGARRTILVVFAIFLLVDRFGFTKDHIILLSLITAIINFFAGPFVGNLLYKIGERALLTIEYIGLILVFLCYAFVDNIWLLAIIYIVDHVFFAMSIGIASYFKKTANPYDFAATSSVSITINHTVAVFMPVALIGVYYVDYRLVFVLGAFLAFISLLLSQGVTSKET